MGCEYLGRLVLAVVSVLPAVSAAELGTETTAVAASPVVLEGHWEGFIQLPGQRLMVKVDIDETVEPATSETAPEVLDGSLEMSPWRGTIDIPQQGAVGLALGDISWQAGELRFTIPGVPGDPTFTASLEGDRWRGWLSQGGARFAFELGREVAEVVPPRRPQNPVEPFPYEEIEAHYTNGEVTLAGTLVVPHGEGPFPAVVLLSGSGPQDRDSTLIGHRPFWVWADHLARQGIAVLRSDDRGVGGSSGDVGGATSSDFADDALAAVEWLVARPEIRRDAIGLLGHSEGGIVAPLAATRSSTVAFVISLAGPALTGAEILMSQVEAIVRASGAGEELVERETSHTRKMVEIALSEEPRESLVVSMRQAVRAKLVVGGGNEAAAERLVEATVEQFLSPWFRWFLSYDPRLALERLTVPTLAIYGERDLQVLPGPNARAALAALETAPVRDFEVLELAGLNHLFQDSELGVPAEYGSIEQTIAPRVLDRVTAWLHQHTRRTAESGH